MQHWTLGSTTPSELGQHCRNIAGATLSQEINNLFRSLQFFIKLETSMLPFLLLFSKIMMRFSF